VFTIALMIAAAVLPAQDKPRPAIDRALVEKFKALTPEQKARLKERVEALKSLPPWERRRLTENLDKFRALPPERQKAVREKLAKMDPGERKKAFEVAAGFFRWMNARYGAMPFPRQPFFRWAAARRPEVFQSLKDLEPGPRIDALLRLAHEYRAVSAQQIRQHGRRHGCVTVEETQPLDDLPFEEFWERADQLRRKCPGAPKRDR
jgi:hypothetical protein